MKITYDKDADAIYVDLKKDNIPNITCSSVQVHNNVIFDYDKNNPESIEVLGIEILNVRSILKKLLK